MSNQDIVVVIADHDILFLKRMEAVFRKAPGFHVAALAQSGQDALARCGEMGPDALVVEYAMPDMSANDIVRELARVSPGTMVFATTGALSATLRATAVNNYGIKDIWDKRYLNFDDMVESVRTQVERHREEDRAHAEKYGRVTPGTGPKGRVACIEAGSVRGPAVLRQAVILIHSPKGGVGKTTIASNLAVALKMSPILSAWNVVLVDADTEFANLAQVLDLPDAGVSRSIASWEYVDDNLTQQDVFDLLAQHRSGVYLLAAPTHPAAGRRISQEVMDKALRVLKKYFGAIVIDGGPKIPDAVMAALEHATDIILVAEPEMQGTENIRRYLTILESTGQDHLINKMRLVVNRLQQDRAELTLKEVSGIAQLPITRTIPWDSQAVRGALHHHNGRLAVEAYPESPFAMAIKALANDLMNAYPGISNAGAVAPQAKRGGFWGLLGRVVAR